MSRPLADNPGVLAPPPLIYLGMLGLGWVAGGLIGEPNLGIEPLVRIGGAVAGLVFGLAINLGAAGLFRLAKTAVQPWKPSTALITTGIYRFTRNPIYLSFAIIYLSLAVGLDSPMAIAFLIPCLLIVERFVIRREERYLASRFGAEYEAYCRQVRRWL